MNKHGSTVLLASHKLLSGTQIKPATDHKNNDHEIIRPAQKNGRKLRIHPDTRLHYMPDHDSVYSKLTPQGKNFDNYCRKATEPGSPNSINRALAETPELLAASWFNKIAITDPHLDLSCMASRDFINFLVTPNGKKWVNNYCEALKQGKILPMPAMQETTKKMIRVLNEFKSMTMVPADDKSRINDLIIMLQINANRNYPSSRSLELALFFSNARDYFFGKYYSEATCLTQHEKAHWRELNEVAKKLTAKDILNIPFHKLMTMSKAEAYQLFSNSAKGPLPIIGLNKMGHYSRLKLSADMLGTESVKLITMSELNINDFNKTAAMKIDFIGLFDKSHTGYHDAKQMSSTEFLLHDMVHASQKNKAFQNAGKLLQTIDEAINSYHQIISVYLDKYEKKLFDHMLFSATHEFQDIFKLCSKTTFKKQFDVIERVQLGFGHNVRGRTGGQFIANPENNDFAESNKILATEEKVVPLFEQFMSEIKSAHENIRPFNPENIKVV